MYSVLLNASFCLEVGIVTTSLCAGKNVSPLVTSAMFSSATVLAISATNVSLINNPVSKKLVFLCFKEAVNNILIDGGVATLGGYMKEILRSLFYG